MPVTITEPGPFERLVTFTVAEHELETAKTQAARKLSGEVKIKGFRPGKAPRAVVEATVGSGKVRSEAIELLLPGRVGTVLTEEDIVPAVTPFLEDVRDTDDGVEVDVKITLWPTLDSVPTYQDRRVEVDSPVVSDEDIEEQVDRMRDQFAELTTVDRSVRPGDFVTVDISAQSGGVEVEEAKGSDLLYEVGSGLFIEGIDDHLAGATAGEVVDFDANLPEGFGDRAGEAASYKAVVKEVKEKVLPVLDDEWVSDVTEFDTVTDLTDSLRERMGEVKRQVSYNQFRDKALSTVMDQIDFELPDMLVRAEMDETLHRFAHRLEEQGVSLDDYFSTTGITQEVFVEDLTNQATRSLNLRLLAESVAAELDLAVSDEEVETALHAAAIRAEDPEAVMNAIQGTAQEENLRSDILRGKALDAIVAAAIPVDEDGNELDLEPPEVEAIPVDADGVEVNAVEGGTEEGVVVAEPVYADSVDIAALEQE